MNTEPAFTVPEDATTDEDAAPSWVVAALSERAEAEETAFESFATDVEERADDQVRWRARYAGYNDVGNAEVLATVCADVLVYDHDRSIWLFFVPARHRWIVVPDTRILVLAIHAARLRGRIAAELLAHDPEDEEGKRLRAWAKQSLSAQSLGATIRVARALDELSVDDQVKWDADPWLLGVPNGVIELKNGGLLRPGRPSDRITKQTLLPYDPHATAPRWEQALRESLPDEAVREYRNRFDGYATTGHTGLEITVTDLGGGSNGKSVHRNPLRRLLGDYGWNLRSDVLLARKRGAHSHETADLEGKRYVTVSELTSKDVVNEEMLKELTSRDAITAHAKYKDSRTFVPTHHLMAAGNTLWKVKDPSEGFWRRNVIIEWPVQFPDDNDATSLALEKELSGIFTWLVRQAVLYAQYGMPPVPESARARTAEYRDNEDDLAEWIEERLVVAEGATLDRTEARNDYYAWCRSNGIKQSDQLSTTDFGSEMARKFKVARPRTTDAEGKRPRVYKDLALRLMEAAPAPGSAPLAVVTMGDIL